MRAFVGEGDEELAGVRPRPPVRHAYQPRSIDFSPAKVLVFEGFLWGIKRAETAGAVAIGDVASLEHELANHAVEDRALVG